MLAVKEWFRVRSIFLSTQSVNQSTQNVLKSAQKAEHVRGEGKTAMPAPAN